MSPPQSGQRPSPTGSGLIRGSERMRPKGPGDRVGTAADTPGSQSAATRVLPLALAVGVVTLYAVLDYIRGVDQIEVFALALFIPIVLATAFGPAKGLVAGVIATVAYAIARRPATDLAGSDVVWRMVVTRALAYLTVGVVGGWLTRVLHGIVVRADATRAEALAAVHRSGADELADTLRREIARADRHRRPLTVITLEGVAVNDPLPALEPHLRTSDVAAVTSAAGTEVVVLLPDTDREGAEIVRDRLVAASKAAASQVHDLAESRSELVSLGDRLCAH